MSRSSIDPDDRQSTDKAEERAAKPAGPGGEDKPRSESGPPERKRTRWLRINRVSEPGTPPRNLSVWLGRLRRKKP